MKRFLLLIFITFALFGMEATFTYRDIRLGENKSGAEILQAYRSDNAFICIVKKVKDQQFSGHSKLRDLSGYEPRPQEETQRLYAELVKFMLQRKQLLAKL